MALELRELPPAPAELAIAPSAPMPPEAPEVVPVAREVTCVFPEPREEPKDRLSRPKPEREPRNCGASNWAKRSAPVVPVRRSVFKIGPLPTVAVRMAACAAA
jgi:hypothetical protein